MKWLTQSRTTYPTFKTSPVRLCSNGDAMNQLTMRVVFGDCMFEAGGDEKTVCELFRAWVQIYQQQPDEIAGEQTLPTKSDTVN